MSAISGSAAQTIQQEQIAPQRDGFADISSQEFLEIMFAELAQQDPFEPQDSQAMLEQLSTIRDIESNMELQDNLELMVEQNGLSSSASFIGKYITGLSQDNRSIAGFVEGLKIEDGKAKLQLDTGETVPVENITDVFEEPGMIDASFQAMMDRVGLTESWKLMGRAIQYNTSDGNQITDTVKRIDIPGGDRVRLLMNSGETVSPGDVTSLIEDE